ncbi:hypothetical protein L484_025712 [Morus notabilis]|uniref:Uncharacterized protein n=1 Tax=Morus notabilis TaxID=981085 RepID=W9R3W6_9ROSA|nr:hypothetical protein L484_025712 [Morus notabilis]
MSGSIRHLGVFDHRKLLILVISVVFLTPLCALERIDSLSLTSAASVALALVFVVVACVVAIINNI